MKETTVHTGAGDIPALIVRDSTAAAATWLEMARYSDTVGISQRYTLGGGGLLISTGLRYLPYTHAPPHLRVYMGYGLWGMARAFPATTKTLRLRLRPNTIRRRKTKMQKILRLILKLKPRMRMRMRILYMLMFYVLPISLLVLVVIVVVVVVLLVVCI